GLHDRRLYGDHSRLQGRSALLTYRCDGTLSEPAQKTSLFDVFRRLKGFRRIFSRFEKLDVLFLGFLNFAVIIEALR
ncbi:MAG: hypothetical protein ABSA39_19675, partial [Edaphobacter sp.]